MALLELWHELQCSSCVGTGISGIAEFQKGCQESFLVSRGNVGFLLRHCSGKGSHLALRGESRGFSLVAAGSLGFLLRCDAHLRDLLVLPSRSHVPFPVARSMSVLVSSC